jgi:hypothetical protein
MMDRRAIFVFLASVAMVPGSAFVSAQTAAKPKISASAVQIAMVDAGEVRIPPEFQFAVYERLVEQVRASGAFQKVYRTGDRASDGVSDLVTLHTKVEGFKEGSETTRNLTTVLGASRVDITASVTARDGHELLSQKITGRVRFFGDNLGVTNDIAKRITKVVHAAALAGR